MDHCFPEMDFSEPADTDISDASSILPFDIVDYAKNDMFMFYPELGYDLHTQLMSQRRRAEAAEKYSLPSSAADDLPGPQIPQNLTMNAKIKKPKLSKSTKNAFVDSMFRSSISSPAPSMAGVDGGEKNRKIFYCRDCGKSFKFQTSLLRHNNKVHNCKYRCPTCHRVFSRQAYLDVHVSKPGSSCFSNYLSTARSRNIKTWEHWVSNVDAVSHFLIVISLLFYFFLISF